MGKTFIKLNPKKWESVYKWQFEAYPFFCSSYQKDAEKSKERYFFRFKYFLSYFHDGHIHAFEPRKGLNKKGNKIIQELLSGNDAFLKKFKQVKDEVDASIEICAEIRKTKDFKNFDKWWPSVQRALSDAAYVIFSFDYTLDDFLQNLEKKSSVEFEAFNRSIQAEQPSFIDEANAKLLELNKKYPKNFDRVYEIFMVEFGWFQNSYKGIFKIDKRWLKNHLEEIKKEKRKVFVKQRINLNPRYRLLSETAKLGVTFRDDKKKLLLIAVELMEKWLKGVCQKNKWKYEELRWLSMDEVLLLLQGKKKYLSMAKKYAQQKKRIGIMNEIGYDNCSESFWKKVIACQDSGKNLKEIKGVIANKGYYKGIVKIILDAKKEAGKLKTGDILVASMTRPEYLPLMKRAGAFVTDEGGITSHASIISRELGKPCIIGTKIATRVLKDGDLVEVDADRGIIKIIK